MKRAPCESAASCTPGGAAHESIGALLNVTPLCAGSDCPSNRRSAPYANEDLRPQQSAPSGGRAPAGSTGSVAVDLGLGALLGVTPLPVQRGSASPSSSSGALARLLNCTPLSDPAAFSGGSEGCSRQEVQERLRSPPLSLAGARPFSSQVYAEAEVVAAAMDLDARECAGEEKEGHKEGGTSSSHPDGDWEYKEDDNMELSLAMTSTRQSDVHGRAR